MLDDALGAALKIAPMILLIGVGHALGHGLRRQGRDVSVLVVALVWIFLPSLLFLTASRGSTASGGAVIAVYFGVVVAAFLAIYGSRAWRARESSAASAICGLNAVFGNVVLLGLPIVGSAFGHEGLAVILSLVAFHSIILLPLATILASPLEPGSRLRTRAGRSLLAVVRNPVIASIGLGTAFRALGLGLPGPIERALELLTEAVPALSLVAIGAAAPGLAPTLKAAHALPLVTKLLALPVCMAVAVRWAGIPAPASEVMVVVAALPTGTNAFLLARQSGTMVEDSATIVTVGTLISLATLPVAIALASRL